MMPKSAEEALIKFQFSKLSGIFACNDFAVICKEKRWVGKWPTGEDVWSWVNTVPRSAPSWWGSFLNTEAFIVAYDSIISSDKFWGHDWLVKADPDAVILPDRIRNHVGGHTGQNCYFTNCAGKLYGALEVYSVEAIGAYKDNRAKCKGMQWGGWGEDLYMQNCLNSIGVAAVFDGNLVGDARCNFAPCTDGSRAAYHPYKDVGSWQGCFNAATHR